MSEHKHPVVMCDGDDGMCGVVELDITCGGLATITDSDTQLPDGWTGARPGDGGEHLCPYCSKKRAATHDDPTEDDHV